MADGSRLYNTIAPLRNVAALVALVDRVRHRGLNLPGMACFYGWSGYGKTQASIYAANKFQAVLVQVKSAWSKRNFCQAVLGEMGLRPRSTVGDMVDQIAQTLAVLDVPLIIDEADHLVARRMIEIVRDIYEGSQAPVVLIGEELLPQKLREWERVHGRMLDWVPAQPADMSDLNHLAPIYAPGVAIDEGLKAEVLRRSAGSTRRVCVNLAAIRERAQVLGLARIGAGEFEVARLFTGTAPAPRRGAA
jgi:hypothetical protein